MNKTYRVFVTRHYIAVEFYDIEAPNEKEAEKAAEKAATKLSPDVRMSATDNHWHADEATEIPYLGYSSFPFVVERVFNYKNSTVFKEIL